MDIITDGMPVLVKEMKVLVSTVAVLVLLGAITPVMALKGYWTPNDTDPGPGLKKYHVFLDGIWDISVICR